MRSVQTMANEKKNLHDIFAEEGDAPFSIGRPFITARSSSRRRQSGRGTMKVTVASGMAKSVSKRTITKSSGTGVVGGIVFRGTKSRKLFHQGIIVNGPKPGKLVHK